MDSAAKRPVAIVTGASRRIGIGAEIARELARRGHDIFFTHWRTYDRQMNYEDRDGPEELATELLAFGARVEHMEADLGDASTPELIVDICVQVLGVPTVLINNAAYSTTQSWEELTAEEIDKHISVNFRASALLSMAFVRHFDQESGGRIISMTSGQGLGPMPTELAYAASKGAIEAWVKSFAFAVGHKGITVNAVNPGPNDTGWMNDDLKDYLQPKFALGRIGTPPDVAKVIGFLVSDESGWITGQVINVEGGFLRD